MASNLTLRRKVSALRSTITNWPLVVLDKLRVFPICTYHTRSGLTVRCRAGSTDINEAVVVLSGLEYPRNYVAVANGSVVFDIGAHIGSFCLYLSEVNRAVSYRCFAFEPFPANAALLRGNLSLNGLEGFEVIQAAVSDRDGTVHLSTAADFDSISINLSGSACATSYRLSSFCRANDIHRIDLLKIDAEGSEYAILSEDGAFISETLRRGIIEYHTLSSELGYEWIRERLSDDFLIRHVHSGPTGVVAIENRRLGREK